MTTNRKPKCAWCGSQNDARPLANSPVLCGPCWYRWSLGYRETPNSVEQILSASLKEV